VAVALKPLMSSLTLTGRARRRHALDRADARGCADARGIVLHDGPERAQEARRLQGVTPCTLVLGAQQISPAYELQPHRSSVLERRRTVTQAARQDRLSVSRSRTNPSPLKRKGRTNDCNQ